MRKRLLMLYIAQVTFWLNEAEIYPYFCEVNQREYIKLHSDALARAWSKLK